MSVLSDEAPNLRAMLDELVAGTISDFGPVEMWDATVLDTFHSEALKATLSTARRSAFFKEKYSCLEFEPSMENWESLPFVEPRELKNKLNELLTCRWSYIAQVNMSSGTTGGPTTYVAFTQEDLNNDGSFYAAKGLFRFDQTELVFVALPYDMATVGFAIHNDVRRQGAAVLPAGKGGTYSSPERLLGAIHDLRPRTLFSTPSYAYYLGELYRQSWPGEQMSIEEVRVGGEGASPAFIKLISSIWDAKVSQWYGSTEAGPIAYSCEYGEYHTLSANVYMEIVDDMGVVVEDGTPGWVVLTTLAREATPVVRLRTGDRGTKESGVCPCGRKLPKFTHLGRMVDQIDVGTMKVSPLQIEEILISSETGFGPWYEIKDIGGKVKILAEPLSPEIYPAKKDLQECFDKYFGCGSIAVEVAPLDTLARPATKMTRVKRTP